jgi:2-methylaconitate isomerase
VRIWQANIEKTIVAHIPVTNGEVQETGDFELDGVTFPAAEVRIDFLRPTGDAPVLPTGNVVDEFQAPGFGRLKATFISAGIPTIFVDAAAIGLTGTELQPAINDHADWLERLETLRAHGGVAMGLLDRIEDAEQRQHTPKIAWVAPPADYVASSGKPFHAADIDLNVRAMSMGKLHHAMMGTAAVAIATAAAIPGTLVNLAAGGGERDAVCFGHPSGTLRVGARVSQSDGHWLAEAVSMSRSARVLMEGRVRIPLPF